MSASDIEVAREIYEAFNRGDVERVKELFDDDIEWEEPAGYFVPEARGTTRGKDAVFTVFAQYPVLLKTFAPTPEEFYDAGDGVVFVTGTQRAEAHDGRTADSAFINLWRIRDGRATLHRSWSDTKTLGSVMD